nr:MAG TPA: hypothetical protein [Caudoviricetes sp.]
MIHQLYQCEFLLILTYFTPIKLNYFYNKNN